MGKVTVAHLFLAIPKGATTRILYALQTRADQYL